MRGLKISLFLIEEITWLLFPDIKASSFTLYLDDGDSLAYRKGKYAAATITVTPVGNPLKVSWSEIEGEGPERIQRLQHTFKILGDAPLEVITC